MPIEITAKDRDDARAQLLAAVDKLLTGFEPGDTFSVDTRTNTVGDALADLIGDLPVSGVKGTVELEDTLTITLVKTRQVSGNDLPLENRA